MEVGHVAHQIQKHIANNHIVGGVVAAVDPDADDDYDNCSGIKDFFGICD